MICRCLWFVVLSAVCEFGPLSQVFAQSERAIKRVREEMVSEQRVALVIGNGAYKDNPLRNPVNDARAMAKALRGCGFEVYEHINVNRKGMFKAAREFMDRLPDVPRLVVPGNHDVPLYRVAERLIDPHAAYRR